MARFFKVVSRSAGFSLRMFSRRENWFTICEASFSERVRCDRNRNPFGEVFSSIGFSRTSLAMALMSISPSNVRLDSRVLDFFIGRVA